jgi:hypothetical protein
MVNGGLHSRLAETPDAHSKLCVSIEMALKCPLEDCHAGWIHGSNVSGDPPGQQPKGALHSFSMKLVQILHTIVSVSPGCPV